MRPGSGAGAAAIEKRARRSSAACFMPPRNVAAQAARLNRRAARPAAADVGSWVIGEPAHALWHGHRPAVAGKKGALQPVPLRQERGDITELAGEGAVDEQDVHPLG
jgi:hypothetical protein